MDVNQELAPNDLSDEGVMWEDLGGPYDITGTTLVVQLIDEANQHVIADAVRIERLGDLAAEIEVRDGPTAIGQVEADGGGLTTGVSARQARARFCRAR